MRVLILVVALVLFGGSQAAAVEMTYEGKTMDVPVCGGFAGIQCEKDQWCDFPDQAVCGMVDQFGTCRPRPEACIEVFMPVCGCDGKTHGNACEAAAAGVDVAYAGTCREAQ